MLAEMKQLVKEKGICVMATLAGGKPHCSLMAYAANDEGTEIYMATLRSTKKFRNITENPAVSLLVDTREEASHRSTARALTIEGVCLRVEDDRKKHWARDRLLGKHPHIEEFVTNSDCEILCVKIQSFLLLKGLTEAYFATLEPISPEGAIHRDTNLSSH